MNGRIGAAARARRWGAGLASAAAGLLLAACGRSSASASQTGAACEVGQLSEQQILAVKRDEPDQPLADLSHYAARQHARAGDAVLNGGGCEDNTSFRFGAGIGDITGPAVGENLLGMADPSQVSAGIQNRNHARAFAFSSQCGGRTGYAMLVNIDNALAFDSIKFGVMQRIAADTANHLADYWTMDNIMISATHTHSSVGGTAHYDYVNLTALGFDQQSFDAAVDGIYNAMLMAHRNLMQATPGTVELAMQELLDTAVNRSPPAYAQDPADERAQFVDTSGREVTTNRMMTLLKLQRDDGTPAGTLNWYSVHGTSIGQTYKLLSGDNKGYAAQRFERDFAKGVYAGGDFVAGFFQSDEGDASPNLFMMDLSEAVLHAHSGDGWDTRGGGRDDYESAMISGYKQYHQAQALWEADGEKLHGEVKAIHLPINMASVVIDEPKTYPAGLEPTLGVQQTCEPAMGVSFGAGAEDGRGPLTEGAVCPLSADQLASASTFLEGLLAPLLEDGALPSGLLQPVLCGTDVAFSLLGYACQQEKPILLPLSVTLAGEPLLLLQARDAPFQIIAIGNLAVIALPWEVTTMSGRRLRKAVLDVLQDAGIEYAVIAGLSNSYVDYLTTREEYAVQNYEGGSNIYGPWSLDAVIQETVRLAQHLRDGTAAASPYEDADYGDHTPLLATHLGLVVADSPLPSGTAYGDVATQPQAEYQMTNDQLLTVSASFYSAHPRDDLMSGSSHLYIDRKTGDGWEIVADDDDWWTRFTYDASGPFATVEWQVPAGTSPGTYRIRYQGHTQDGSAYSGTSDAFVLKGCS
ncbi:MAG: neutral/alkaline non-lysosomal ceramidase N-terminal domain-containing protein [Solimonas sp.]